MTEFKRIIPEEVVEAYQRTGVLPIRNTWGCSGYDKECACGITAVAMSKNDCTFEQLVTMKLDRDEHFYEEFYQELLNVPNTYIIGFAHGFDGTEASRYEDATYLKGVEDGEAAFKLVSKEFEIMTMKKLSSGVKVMKE